MVIFDMSIANTVFGESGGFSVELSLSSGTMTGIGVCYYINPVLVDGNPSNLSATLYANGAISTQTLVVGASPNASTQPAPLQITYTFTANTTATFRLEFGAVSGTARNFAGSIMKYKQIG